MDTGPLTDLTAEEVLADLNTALVAERQAVADYDARAKACREAAIREALETLRDVEQEHALRLASRIVALGGTPVSEIPRPRLGGETLSDGLTLDLQGEQWAIVEYARLTAGVLRDEDTAELACELLFDEIRHATWLKTTLHALEGRG
jgi:bacterioferritin (cytochrome b1)